MLNLNSTTLAQVVNSARRATTDTRWLNAITRAAEELAENPYIARQDNHLLIGSPSGQIYEANGACQCTAYLVGQPCWHRAAARLVRRHDEAIARQAARPAYDKAVAEMMECFA